MANTESLAVSQVEVVERAGSEYKVSIVMDAVTVDDLQAQGFSLYAFKAVKSPLKGGAPLVWLETTNYSTNTELSWKEEYQAYTSRTEIKAGARINASFSEEIALGQTLKVTGEAGTGEVVNGGTAGMISILNETNKRFTCGIKQRQSSGEITMLCAFPLFGENLDTIVPIQKVLLMYATQTVNTGTVLFKAFSSGVMIDLTGKNQRTVKYHIDGGWSWDGGSWGQKVRANDDLVPLLIQP
jgi:hypothetical protein